MAYSYSMKNDNGKTRDALYTLIANVPFDTVRQDLVCEFRRFGRVELVMVVCDEASRHPHKEWTSTAGYAFVRFSNRNEASAAIQAANLGLISIKGNKVRADWAHKDSYAKRGRVLSSQGAPILGKSGMPDGIEVLQKKLSNYKHNFLTNANSNEDNVQFHKKLDADSKSNLMVTRSYGNDDSLYLTHTPRSTKKNTLSSNSTQIWNSSKWNDSSTSDLSMITTPSNESLYINKWSDGEYGFRNISLESSCPIYTPNEYDTTGKITPIIHYDNILSPCSRGLLTQALNDVSSNYNVSPEMLVRLPSHRLECIPM